MRILLTTCRYGTEPFSSANGQIPQLNMWDDHDVSRTFSYLSVPKLYLLHHSPNSLTDN